MSEVKTVVVNGVIKGSTTVSTFSETNGPGGTKYRKVLLRKVKVDGTYYPQFVADKEGEWYKISS